MRAMSQFFPRMAAGGVTVASLVLVLLSGSAFSETYTIDQIMSRDRKAIVYLKCKYVDINNNVQSCESGTGLFVTKDGYIITVRHVIKDWLRLGPDVREKYPLQGLIGSSHGDPIDLEVRYLGDWGTDDDIVLLHSLNPSKQYSSAPICYVKAVRTGIALYAFGFPNGKELFPAPGTFGDTNGENGYWTAGIQIDRGMSGGPVYDREGNVIALVEGGVAMLSTPSYLIPLNRIQPILASRTSVLPTCTDEEQQWSQNEASNFSDAEVDALKDVDIVYYQKAADSRVVGDILADKRLSITTLDPVNKLPSNVIKCTDSVSGDAIRVLAAALIKRGVLLRAVRRLDYETDKPRLTIEADEDLVRKDNLNRDDLEKIRACPEPEIDYSVLDGQTFEIAKRGKYQGLSAYISSCNAATARTPPCGHVEEAQRIITSEANQFAAAHGNIANLRSYVSNCTACSYTDQAQVEISRLSYWQVMYTFRMCNSSVDEVEVALAGTKNQGSNDLFIDAWLTVESGKCADLGNYTRQGHLYWFAKSTTSRKTWGGDERKKNGLGFCVPLDKAVNILHVRQNCGDDQYRYFMGVSVGDEAVHQEKIGDGYN